MAKQVDGLAVRPQGETAADGAPQWLEASGTGSSPGSAASPTGAEPTHRTFVVVLLLALGFLVLVDSLLRGGGLWGAPSSRSWS